MQGVICQLLKILAGVLQLGMGLVHTLFRVLHLTVLLITIARADSVLHRVSLVAGFQRFVIINVSAVAMLLR